MSDSDINSIFGELGELRADMRRAHQDRTELRGDITAIRTDLDRLVRAAHMAEGGWWTAVKLSGAIIALSGLLAWIVGVLKIKIGA